MPPAADLLQSRPARGDDEAALLVLMRDFYAEEHLAFDPPHAQRALRELLSHPDFGRVLLLEWSGAPVGYIALTFGFSLEFHGRYALLDEFYLVPAVRGRGWGRHGLELATATAQAHGVANLRLEVSRANARARAIYLKAGFHDDQRDMFTQRLP